ncbi:MAG: hypothetical protein F6K00_25345 [Leptolyngbya sp. SIOISBB]|nr:hypothetical protein [Leptolyngbya sp. SIOISBB]
MNAASHAVTAELTSKIAHLAVLFRAEFADVRVDLNPWLTDAKTQRQLDPHSIDLSFFFPKRHLGMTCNCILLRVRFSEGLLQPTCKLTHVEADGYNHVDPQWSFSTSNGQFTGECPPLPEYQARFRTVINRILLLFEYPNQVNPRLSGYGF